MLGNIVFVGAGGAGISNLVGILYDLGFRNLIGVDASESQQVQQHMSRGIKVFPHGIYNIQPDDVVIYSSATSESEEVQAAFSIKTEGKKPMLVWDYFAFLGEMSKYFRTVGFTGTNGKSSSSAMAISVARKVVPHFGIGIVGALVPDFGGKSYVVGGDVSPDLSAARDEIQRIFQFIFTGKKLDYSLIKKYRFFVEACEYQRHFLNLQLEYALITNLELDHADYFKDFADYEAAFIEMTEHVKEKVFVLPDLASETIKSKSNVEVISAFSAFDFRYLLGDFQQENGKLVEAVLGAVLDATLQDGGDVKASVHPLIEQFHGVRRRMEELTTLPNGTKIYSDYGHVASSLALGYAALKAKFPDRKLICIFQPHQVHRIQQGWDDFPGAMQGYDEVYVYDIYAARESYSPEEILQLGKRFAQHVGGQYLTAFSEIETVIKTADADSVIVLFTAGDGDWKLRSSLGLTDH